MEFDPSVVGGMFAGLDHEQIGGYDHETMEAALEATGANLLGGLGAFDELAGLADLAAVLEHDGSSEIHDEVFNFFGGNLFGTN